MKYDVANAIAVAGLAKRFGDVQAVEEVSFKVYQGELYGFLGPNGAGKTTTINMLTGLARPDAGAIRLAGIECTGNPKGVQHLVGVVPSSFVLRLPGLHVDFTTELVAGLYSGGTVAVWDHPLGNSNQFHPDLRGIPRFRACLGTSIPWL